MTTANQTTVERTRVTSVLPWILAGAALLFYLATLNHWVSLNTFSQPPYASNSLAEVSRVSGWTWQPALLEPLYWLATYPFHWLPDKFIPLALNLFSAVMAGVTLWLLARSIAILPHNRTEDQRARERHPFAILSTPTAWVPPTFGVLVCGMQLSFWENATVASGEILKLMLFAYVIRCILEYRLDDRPAWLYKAIFVFSAGMTNSWGMIGYLPIFLAALIWLRGLAFFNLTFLSRAAMCAFAGLLFYLLLPVVAAVGSNVDVTFWQALKYNLGSQKGLLAAITFNKYSLFLSDRPLWVLALPSLLPLLFMSVRWPSYFGDPSRIGVALATLSFHFFHAMLFVVCLWVMLDPQFSPRQVLPGTPLLSLYYLCALGIGYFAGYFLLVFGVKPGRRQRPGLPEMPIVGAAVIGVTGALLLATPAALLYRNLPVITALNGPLKDKTQTPARQYAEASIVGLPAAGGVVLSDDIRRLSLVRSALTASGRQRDFVFLHTQSLKWADYHPFLERENPGRWKNWVPPGTKGEIDGGSLVQVLFMLAQTNATFYLHPSFGYYFEAFHLIPQGIVYRLEPYSTNNLLAPPLPKATLDYNERFWEQADQHAVGKVLSIGKTERRSPENFVDRLLDRAHLSPQTDRDTAQIAGFYSQARDYWAIEMQKVRSYEKAAAHFSRALELKPDNIVAKVNLAWNRYIQSGEKTPSEFSKDVDDVFGKYRTWDQLMNENGPFDEPRFCFEQGRVYVRGSLYRQAAHQFQRSAELEPNQIAARLWLAQVYVITRFPDKALELIGEVRANRSLAEAITTNSLELMSIEASALLVKNQPDRAEAVVNATISRQPGDATLLATAAQMFINYGDLTNAVKLLNRQLKLDPTNISAHVNLGFVYLQMKRFEEAIPPLTRALTLETNQTSELHQSALFNRAISNLQVGKLDDARRDYEALQQLYPTAFKIYYGLAEIDYRSKDTNAAIRNYQLYLANAPTNTSEARFVTERLKELGGKGS